MRNNRRPFEKTAGLVVVWEFRIRTAKRHAFEEAYGPSGRWVRFFRKAKGYLGTELLCDPRHPNRYLTFDFWQSSKHYERFKDKNRPMYQAIDRECESLTTKESELEQFSAARSRS